MVEEILEEGFDEAIYGGEIEPREDYERWQLANHEEDQVIALIDRKKRVEEVLVGREDAAEICWLARLLFIRPQELSEEVECKSHKRISKSKLQSLMRLLGFGRKRVEAVLAKIF